MPVAVFHATIDSFHSGAVPAERNTIHVPLQPAHLIESAQTQNAVRKRVLTAAGNVQDD